MSIPTRLTPRYVLPVAFLALAVPVALLQPWLGGVCALFGLFLWVQAATLRLQFTTEAMDVLRGDRPIRHFPYQDWLNWAIFWPPAPILFYFREVKSIHFLPVLFDPSELRSALEQNLPSLPAAAAAAADSLENQN